jgi:hypothetical protein
MGIEDLPADGIDLVRGATLEVANIDLIVKGVTLKVVGIGLTVKSVSLKVLDTD